MKKRTWITVLVVASMMAVAAGCGGGKTGAATTQDTGVNTDNADGDSGIPSATDPGAQGEDLAVSDALDVSDATRMDTDTAVDVGMDAGTEEVRGDVDADTTDGDTLTDAFETTDTPGDRLTGEDVSDIRVPVCEDDGLKCTTEETGSDGVCTHPIMPNYCVINGKCYFRMQVDPDNPCLFCVPETSQTAFSPSPGMPCDDHNACTSPDTCDKTGHCVPGPKVDCNDHNICTKEHCDPALGCVYKPFTAACNDHSVCTTGDHCVNGKCVGHTVRTDDGNPCTVDGCDPVTGVFHKKLDGVPCDDGYVCTVNDHCVNGTCKGEVNHCDDNDPCTKDFCNEAAGGCMHTWYYGACDDHDACTTASVCNSEHKCVGNQIDCNDFNPCTKDSCDPKKGCVHTPVDGTCDDGDPCTDNDRCVEGKCTGTPKDCTDSNLCTRDFCDPVHGCEHEYSSGPCDDGDACTKNDNCSTGKCIGQPVDCDDHNPCTHDWCDSVLGCVHDPVEGLCDDGDTCTTGDHCENGKCVGHQVDCDDGDPCTDDMCADGACFHEPHVGACDDGNACTQGEICVDDNCTGGQPVDCNDHNDCTIDDCDTKWGCVYTPTGPGPCDDHSVCTVNDQCENGKCVGTHIDCDDHNQCTNDPCDPVKGCYHTPRDGKCNDHDVCTTDDRCIDGDCGGTPKYNDPVLAASTFSAGVSGNPGQGLDVDGDPSTCTPKGSCLQGIDNQLSSIAWLMNPGYTEQVSQGAFTVIFENRGDTFPGGLALYTGRRADAACNPEDSECNVLFFDESIDDACMPRGTLEEPGMTGVALSAGGPGSVVPMRLVFGKLQVPVQLYMARVKATTKLDDTGYPQSMVGVLGGCIIKDDLVQAIDAIPADQFTEPYTKEVVSAYVDSYLTPDIDRDKDGTPDCVSAGFVFTVDRAHIRGHEAGNP